jgi:GDSL-like Lipase/Acylhydrolase family
MIASLRALLTIGIAFVAVLEAQPPREDWTVHVDPALPNVMVIGDSISIGYGPEVRKLLAGKANVFRPMRQGGKTPENGGSTYIGLKELNQWLGDYEYSVIHFNWGLHDVHHRNAVTREPKLGDKEHLPAAISLPDYKRNLERLLTMLEKTGARLIWASTTIVPDGDIGRVAGEEKKYNEAAKEIMDRHHIPVDDLYALTASFPPAMFREPGNVHYSPEGYRRLAQQVARSIEQALAHR